MYHRPSSPLLPCMKSIAAFTVTAGLAFTLAACSTSASPYGRPASKLAGQLGICANAQPYNAGDTVATCVAQKIVVGSVTKDSQVTMLGVVEDGHGACEIVGAGWTVTDSAGAANIYEHSEPVAKAVRAGKAAEVHC